MRGALAKKMWRYRVLEARRRAYLGLKTVLFTCSLTIQIYSAQIYSNSIDNHLLGILLFGTRLKKEKYTIFF